MHSNLSLRRAVFWGGLSIASIGLLWIGANAFVRPPVPRPDNAISKIPIGPATWRLVQLDLDNVYQDPAVSNLRNELMTKYAKSMAETDAMPSWAGQAQSHKKQSPPMRRCARP